MCGIAGISLPKNQKATQAQLQPLADALAHRGPNGFGFFTHATLGLAHRRLSIIDVNGGAQPITSSTHALVANGEIYNYKALQTEVLQAGITLRTGSDCEPPLHLFALHGESIFNRLHGMYALAIACAKTETLHLATDPFGIKPLYYAETSIGFIFASEPKALLRGSWVRPQANLEILPQLLNRHYTVGDATLFKNIRRMLPGERLTVRHGKIIARSRHLPTLTGGSSAGVSPSGERRADHLTVFNEQLTNAVARHLQADVPYGLLLSGGLDSTALALAMHRLGAPVHAYTAVIQVQGGPNEATTAAEVCKRIGAIHTTVEYTEEDFWNALIPLAESMDDLATDYAALPLLKLTARAAQDVKILLSGEGGDELLAGYSTYRKKPSLFSWWKNRRSGDAAPLSNLFRVGVTTPAAPAQPWSTSGFTALQKRQAQDINGWLPHDLLLKLDRTTMTNGIEGRVPYLDDTFAQYAFSLPDSLKINKDFGKLILRQHLAAQGYEQLAWARKQGFSVAVGAFLKNRPTQLKALWQNSSVLSEILHPHAAEKLLGNLGHAKSANLAFSLTLLALWHQLHIEQQHPQQLAHILQA